MDASARGDAERFNPVLPEVNTQIHPGVNLLLPVVGEDYERVFVFEALPQGSDGGINGFHCLKLALAQRAVVVLHPIDRGEVDEEQIRLAFFVEIEG